MADQSTLRLQNTKVFCLAICVLGILCSSTVGAQATLVDRRDQAEGWYLPVHGSVMIDGEKATDFKVIVYKDNLETAKVDADKKGRYHLELDIDANYTVRILKDGYQEKIVLIETFLPKDLVKYPDYACTVSLQKSASKNIDPFYTDFPSAVIRYNEELGGFYHSEHYLTHIQTKLEGYANASF